MFQQMADGHVATTEAAPERVLERLREMGADVRECALLGPGGTLLAASADAEWETRLGELWEAAAEGAGAEPRQIHVATDEGEVFAVRADDGTTLTAVTPRFALESLMFCDLRAALREMDEHAS